MILLLLNLYCFLKLIINDEKKVWLKQVKFQYLRMLCNKKCFDWGTCSLHVQKIIIFVVLWMEICYVQFPVFFHVIIVNMCTKLLFKLCMFINTSWDCTKSVNKRYKNPQVNKLVPNLFQLNSTISHLRN